MAKMEVFNTIEGATKMLVMLPLLFGLENKENYDELSQTVLETSLIKEPIDNNNGTFTDYLAYSEKGHFGDGKIGIYKLIRSWEYDPFDDVKGLYHVEELLKFEPRRVRTLDTDNGTITFINNEGKDVVYSVLQQNFIA